MKELTIKLFKDDDVIELLVRYNPTHLEDSYEVLQALHNYADITHFWLLCDKNREALFYGDICEEIAKRSAA